MSLAQGGPAPQFLAPIVVKHLLGEALMVEEMLLYIEDPFKTHILEVLVYVWIFLF